VPFPGPFYRWRPHPWHGLEVGPEPPRVVNAHLEMTPFDGVKYELARPPDTCAWTALSSPRRSRRRSTASSRALLRRTRARADGGAPAGAGEVQIGQAYGRDRAFRVIRAAMADYEDELGGSSAV
jgi:hypothetical protein